MPDVALLALVRNQLSAVTSKFDFAAALGAKRGRRGALAVPAGKRGRRGRARSEERQAMLDKIEKFVKANGGVSASEVAKAAAIPQTRAAAHLKELKLAKRIFQGGDRRFARYAGDAKAAEQASVSARKNAAGPTRPAPKAKKRAKRG